MNVLVNIQTINSSVAIQYATKIITTTKNQYSMCLFMLKRILTPSISFFHSPNRISMSSVMIWDLSIFRFHRSNHIEPNMLFEQKKNSLISVYIFSIIISFKQMIIIFSWFACNCVHVQYNKIDSDVMNILETIFNRIQ